MHQLRIAPNAAAAGRHVRVRAFWVLIAILVGALLTRLIGVMSVVIGGVTAWLAFSAFTFVFFRDPAPDVPPNDDVIVAPAHGRVDFVGQYRDSDFAGGLRKNGWPTRQFKCCNQELLIAISPPDHESESTV